MAPPSNPCSGTNPVTTEPDSGDQDQPAQRPGGGGIPRVLSLLCALAILVYALFWTLGSVLLVMGDDILLSAQEQHRAQISGDRAGYYARRLERVLETPDPRQQSRLRRELYSEFGAESFMRLELASYFERPLVRRLGHAFRVRVLLGFILLLSACFILARFRWGLSLATVICAIFIGTSGFEALTIAERSPTIIHDITADTLASARELNDIIGLDHFNPPLDDFRAFRGRPATGFALVYFLLNVFPLVGFLFVLAHPKIRGAFAPRA